jgi:hypothetical protein
MTILAASPALDALETASVTCSDPRSDRRIVATFLTRAAPSDIVACVTTFARERGLCPSRVNVAIQWPNGLNDCF